MTVEMLLLHAMTPLHAGTGQSVDIIDLPIARERATNIPFLPGSSVKGALRAAVEERGDPVVADRLFGWRKRAEMDDPEVAGFAGALAFGDALLLLFPVRSASGVFAFATCPMQLGRAAVVAKATGGQDDFATRIERVAALARDHREDVLLASRTSLIARPSTATFDEFDFVVRQERAIDDLGLTLADLLELPRDYLQQRIAVLPDTDFAWFTERATEIRTRVRIDDATRTVAPGALWSEESLPPESVLCSYVQSFGSRKPNDDAFRTPQSVLDRLWPDDGANVVQHTFGGKETTGHGRVRVCRGRGKK